MVKAAWLTVNRKCNFRCLWCYAEGTTKIPDMRLTTALRLINISLDVGIKDFVLLGGEPTYWPQLNALCDYINRHEAEATIVTNGYKYEDFDLAKKAHETGAKINISIKAGNPNQYKCLTKVNAYAKVMQAIDNFAKINPVSVSITASALVIDNLEELVKEAIEHGAGHVLIEFCAATFDKEGKPQQGYMLNPSDMAKKIADKYDCLGHYDNLSFMQTLPFCLYPDGFIAKLAERGQLQSGCHVMTHSGVIFTTEGAVLLCNCLHGLELGKLDVNFHDAESFNLFWQSKAVTKANESLVCYPHRRCMSCPEYDRCCGGCPLQWFVFNPLHILQECQNVTVRNENGYGDCTHVEAARMDG